VPTAAHAERPRRGENLSAARQGRFPGVGIMALIYFVTAERKSLSVHAAG
jgi:hypothetical protein